MLSDAEVGAPTPVAQWIEEPYLSKRIGLLFELILRRWRYLVTATWKWLKVAQLVNQHFGRSRKRPIPYIAAMLNVMA